MRFSLRHFAFLLLLTAPAAQAQLWSGPAALEVRVEDQKGLPVAGARLQLQYNALDPKAGPPAVLTDARGRATVGGLAEGSWHLEVSQEGFMTYLAEITVRDKGRPVLEEAAQFHVTGSTRTMRVQISRGRSAPTPPAPTVAGRAPAPQAPAPTPATTPAEATPAPAPAPTAPAPTATERTPRTATKEPVKPEPAPAAPPASATPEPSRETPAAPPTQETMPVPVPEPATPPAPAPSRPAPTPVPEPAQPQDSASVPQPAAPPAATPAPAPPTDPVRLRTATDRTCFECPPGESALSAERVVPPGGGSGCGDISGQLAGGQVPAGLSAGCHVLRIALPPGARYTGYRYEIQDRGESLDCLAGRDCPQGTGRWPVNPVLVRRPEGTIILAPFEAGAAERERRAVLTVYFSTGSARRR